MRRWNTSRQAEVSAICAVIQDLGYYPFGNKEFSNLVHHVRRGDSVREKAGLNPGLGPDGANAVTA
jgi:hypothetical protein